MSEVPWIEAGTIGSEEAHATWALAARMRLEEAARDYHGVVTLAALADWVQERSRVRTRRAPRHWMADVLYRTMQDNHDHGEPFLAALCVDDDGRVGTQYGGVVGFLRGRDPADADDHAAHERLSCYRWFGATLPEGGGEPGPRPQVRDAATPRERSTSRRRPSAPSRPSGSPGPAATGARPGAGRVARSDVVPKICPRCFMALPASGQCDNCD